MKFAREKRNDATGNQNTIRSRYPLSHPFSLAPKLLEVGTNLKLGLLGLEDSVELGCEHNVALDLQLARHECLLAVELAVGHVHED